MSLRKSTKHHSDSYLLKNLGNDAQINKEVRNVKSLNALAALADTPANANLDVVAKAASLGNARAYRSLDKEFDRNVARQTQNLMNLKRLMSSKKITNFLQMQLVRKNYDLTKRLQFHAYMQNHMAPLKLNECLQRETVKTFRYQNMDVYNIANVIYLMRPIGSESVFGIVYSADVKQTLGSAPIAAKIMAATRGNKREIDINQRVSRCVLQQVTPHFVLYYRSFECMQKKVPQQAAASEQITGDNKSMVNFLNTNYFIALTERVDGDLKSLFNNRRILAHTNLLTNIACQCMIAILTFHRVGYLHQDCHWGNFLYHKTDKKGGYYHYIIDGVDYFLEDYGYTIMIYDFGKAVKIDRASIPDKLKDYTKILNAFSNKTHYGWVKYADLPAENISTKMKQFRSRMKQKADRYTSEEMYIRDILKFFQYHMLTNEKLPAGAKILNAVPYRIDSSLASI